MTWKITTEGPRAWVEAALARQESSPDWDEEIVVAGSEVAEDEPDRWRFEAWLPRQPSPAELARVAALFPAPHPQLAAESLAERDWVAESQAGLEPILAGRFRVRTPDHPPLDEQGRRDFVIPASRAFGTGHHATTAGCLEMLTRIAAEGAQVASFADIGTGTGLLAFAARELWPDAAGIASDIDPVCAAVVAENAALNGVPLGHGPGELAFVVADGMGDPELGRRAPFDLIVANILAGPLIALAPDFTATLSPQGHLVLAGLLTSQEDAVRAACEEVGLGLAQRLHRGDWSILWLRA